MFTMFNVLPSFPTRGKGFCGLYRPSGDAKQQMLRSRKQLPVGKLTISKFKSMFVGVLLYSTEYNSKIDNLEIKIYYRCRYHPNLLHDRPVRELWEACQNHFRYAESRCA